MSDYEIGYIFTDEAWYRDTVRSRGGNRDMTIGTYAPEGGCTWEFSVTENMHSTHPARSPFLVPKTGVLGIQVDIFDDAWTALADPRLAPFWSGLAALSSHERHDSTSPHTLDVVRDLCDRLGFIDRTAREPGR